MILVSKNPSLNVNVERAFSEAEMGFDGRLMREKKTIPLMGSGKSVKGQAVKGQGKSVKGQVVNGQGKSVKGQAEVCERDRL